MINTFLHHRARSMLYALLLLAGPQAAHSDPGVYCLTSISYRVDDPEGAWPSGTHPVTPPHCDLTQPYVWDRKISDVYWGTKSNVSVGQTLLSLSRYLLTFPGFALTSKWEYTNGQWFGGGYNGQIETTTKPTVIQQGARGALNIHVSSPAIKLTSSNNTREDVVFRVKNNTQYTGAYGEWHDRDLTVVTTLGYERMNNTISAYLREASQSCTAKDGQCNLKNTLTIETTTGALFKVKPNISYSGAVTQCHATLRKLTYIDSTGEYILTSNAGKSKIDSPLYVDLRTKLGVGQCVINFDVSLL